MNRPQLSLHFQNRKPSAIRTAQIEYMKRADGVEAINTAIGNVSLPMHPAMIVRMGSLNTEGPFKEGVVKYSPTVGTTECCETVLHVMASSGIDTTGLFTMITDGGSAAMELLFIGLCGPAGSSENPLLLIDAAYTNYNALAARTGRKTVSVQRQLGEDGKFSLPEIAEIEKTIQDQRPSALLLIPYDNPTGHYYDQTTIVSLCRLCVKYNMWVISDEAYRELYYCGGEPSSLWRVTEDEVPGILGRRISIETASKVWNACGLRVGALVTDNQAFHAKAVAEYTANLCSNVIGQHIFAALAAENHAALKKWYQQQRGYYQELMTSVYSGFKDCLPGLIVSSPDAAIYAVIDVRKIAKPGFNAEDFVLYCARKGVVSWGDKKLTLLVSPMAEFYQTPANKPNPGQTQMRIAFVETPERMRLVPKLFSELFHQYEKMAVSPRA